MSPRNSRCEPIHPIPSYDEAVPGRSNHRVFGTTSPEEDEIEHLVHHVNETEGRPLARNPFGPTTPVSTTIGQQLSHSRTPVNSSRKCRSWDFDTDTGAAHARKEMEELEIDDVEADARPLSPLWGKRIGFSESQSHHRRLSSPKTAANATPVVLKRFLASLATLGFLYLLLMRAPFSGTTRDMGQGTYDAESLRIHIQSAVDGQRMRDMVRHFTSYAHMAGTEGDFALAMDTRNMFLEYGLEGVSVDEYYVYMNYPTEWGRAIEILDAEDEVIWAAQLEEDDIGDKAGRQTYVFHGHSKSGDVKGPLIYVNYGSKEDFKFLSDNGIDTKGAIALTRYYGTQGDPALKVKAAEDAGFAGCIVYNDPADNGFVRGPTAPDGRYMPVDGVQRGGVSLGSWVAGDVLTPGWGSKEDAPRLSKDETLGLVKIPSIPISWRDAKVLLRHLQGIGQKVPDGWTGGVPGTGDWFIGNQSSPTIRLKNEQVEEEKQPIWNIYGRIVGTEERDKRIIIGNHRDSWTFGAADPHSGTAILMELARIFGGLLATGWRPRRTIEFMSWDGEEYNLIGSTEYVEQNADILREHGLAYINLDTVVSGPTFHGIGSPMFQKLVLEVLENVTDPNYNATLRELWDRHGSKFEGLDSGSDYVPFQAIVGTSSLDIFFSSKERYPFHSSYDNFEWMDRVGDPSFRYHTLIGQVLGLLVLELADRPVIPFDITAYATSLSGWISNLIRWSEDKGLNEDGNAPVHLNILCDAADEVALAAKDFGKWEMSWKKNIIAQGNSEPSEMVTRRIQYNSRIAKFESDLLDSQGIPNRTQFKHVIFGPQLWPRENPVYFPSIVDAILAGEWDLANKTVERVSAIIIQAARNLVS